MARALRTPVPSTVQKPVEVPKINLVPRKLEYIPEGLHNPNGHFHLISAEIVPLTRELAKEFAEMEATVIDQKVDNLLGVLDWDLAAATNTENTFTTMFSFE